MSTIRRIASTMNGYTLWAFNPQGALNPRLRQD